MRIRRLFAENARLATRLVREELGADAVILSNRRVEGGVEIVAATDYDESLVGDEAGLQALLAAEQSDREVTAEPPQGASATAPPEPAAATPEAARVVWSQDPLLSGMRRELADLRQLLEGHVAGLAWADYARRSPPQARLLTRLHEFGLAPNLCQELVAGLTGELSADDAERLALERLAAALPIARGGVVDDGGVYAVVGPTGVGKTTTVAKLAARYTMRHGPGRVAILTTDCLRVGAYEQLRTFGRILDVPVKLARDAEELKDALQGFVDMPLVLVDTAGMSQRDMRLAEQLSVLSGAGPCLKIFLVLAANAQRLSLSETLQAFQGIELAACVATKLDETRRYGDVLSVVAENALPLAYVSDGQKVPDDLHAADSRSLVSAGWTLLNRDEPPLTEATHALTFGRKVANGYV
jgi:flagellar biosynthesis protein FlhF